jgi:hypothetical protein
MNGAVAGGSGFVADAAGADCSDVKRGAWSALPISLQFQPLRSAVGTQLYFLPGWNVSLVLYCAGCAMADATQDKAIRNAAVLLTRRITRFQSLTEHDVEAALELRVARMFEGVQRIVAFQIHIALEAYAAALQAPFARERPAAEQILLQCDLVITRRFGRRWLGLHENAHPASLTRDAARVANVATLSSGCR